MFVRHVEIERVGTEINLLIPSKLAEFTDMDLSKKLRILPPTENAFPNEVRQINLALHTIRKSQPHAIIGDRPDLNDAFHDQPTIPLNSIAGKNSNHHEWKLEVSPILLNRPLPSHSFDLLRQELVDARMISNVSAPNRRALAGPIPRTFNRSLSVRGSARARSLRVRSG